MRKLHHKLPPLAREFVQSAGVDCDRVLALVQRFHWWLAVQDIALSELDAPHAERFFERPFRKRLKPATTRNYKRELLTYLLWLHRRGAITFDPVCLNVEPRSRSIELPPLALEFLQTPEGRGTERALRRFHGWLEAKHVALSGLQPTEAKRFFEQPFRRMLTPRTAQLYKRGLIGYLAWLDKKGALPFDPKCLGIRRKRPLPALALGFLESLKPTHKVSTCNTYRTSLQNFHEWLDDAQLQLICIQRQQLEQWLLSLNDRGLHPSTRCSTIMNVRCYLRWLFERDALDQDPDALIRSTDFPKLPAYLPRPLAPNIDLELQRRLEESDESLWQALLLMRHTGLRAGELLALEYDCERVDHHGNHFLKVPLGKLDNERLVPLAEKTSLLIRSLQTKGAQPRQYLIETAPGKRAKYWHLTDALREASDGLTDGAAITSHRLRHSFATTLLNGGMSLVGVMKLLGHRDYRMTLRYTAITQESVGREYFEALSRLEGRYGTRSSMNVEATTDLDVIKALADIAAWTKKNIGHAKGEKRLARALTKRIDRIQADLRALIEQPT